MFLQGRISHKGEGDQGPHLLVRRHSLEPFESSTVKTLVGIWLKVVCLKSTLRSSTDQRLFGETLAVKVSLTRPKIGHRKTNDESPELPGLGFRQRGGGVSFRNGMDFCPQQSQLTTPSNTTFAINNMSADHSYDLLCLENPLLDIQGKG